MSDDRSKVAASGAWAETLHDAVLKRIVVDWQAKTVGVHLLPVGGADTPSAVIAGSGIRLVQLPYEEPWGASVSIHEVRLAAADVGEQLSIQMQSGDSIVIEAASFSYNIRGS